MHTKPTANCIPICWNIAYMSRWVICSSDPLASAHKIIDMALQKLIRMRQRVSIIVFFSLDLEQRKIQLFHYSCVRFAIHLEHNSISSVFLMAIKNIRCPSELTTFPNCSYSPRQLSSIWIVIQVEIGLNGHRAFQPILSILFGK